MIRLVFFVLAALLLTGCQMMGGNQAAQSKLAGNWTGGDTSSKSTWMLAEDGTFAAVLGNQFAAAVVGGAYSTTGDQVTFTIKIPNAASPLTYNYKWLGPDSISLASTLDPTHPQILTRSGTTLKTASVDGLASGGLAGDDKGARIKAESVACTSNLKMIGTAMLMYAQDYDSFPSADGWSDKLAPYLKDPAALTCPTLAKEGKKGGYAMNSALSSANFKSLTKPEGQVLVYESGEGYGSGDPATNGLTTARHETIGALYADGHCKNHLPGQN